MTIRKRLTRIASRVENAYDDFVFDLKKRLNIQDDLQIVAYRTYGSQQHFYVKGRVLQNKPIVKSTRADSAFKNILRMYQRFETDEVRQAEVRLTFQDSEYSVLTDDEGYFVITFAPRFPLAVDDRKND